MYFILGRLKSNAALFLNKDETEENKTTDVLLFIC